MLMKIRLVVVIHTCVTSVACYAAKLVGHLFCIDRLSIMTKSVLRLVGQYSDGLVELGKNFI